MERYLTECNYKIGIDKIDRDKCETKDIPKSPDNNIDDNNDHDHDIIKELVVKCKTNSFLVNLSSLSYRKIV